MCLKRQFWANRENEGTEQMTQFPKSGTVLNRLSSDFENSEIFLALTSSII